MLYFDHGMNRGGQEPLENAMNKKFIIISLLVLVIIGIADYFYFDMTDTKLDVKPAVKSNSSGIYRNDQFGFEIQRPQDWTTDESGKLGTAVIFLNPTADQSRDQSFFANINVLVRPITNLGVNNLEEYVTLDKSMLLKYKQDVKFYPDEKVLLINGKEGIIVNLTFMKNNMLVRDRHLITLENNAAYVSAATALASTWDIYADLFKLTLSSFKFIR